MKYDGKIKNGIELKESEDNLFQRIIIKRPKILKRINMKISKILKENSEVWYSLSYDEEKHRYFDKNFLLSYLRDNYLNNKDIQPTKLNNDLITFKTYRDYVDITVRKENDFYQFLTIAIAIITILASIFKMININLMAVIIPLGLVCYGNYMFKTSVYSESYKLKVINNVIYTLETIKEDMDKNENSLDKYKATKNKYSPWAMHERKRR